MSPGPKTIAGPSAAAGKIARAMWAGFTLLEVMIAIAVLGIALLALLSLEHQDLQSVIRGQEISRAAMLAQALMTQAELERFPGARHYQRQLRPDVPRPVSQLPLDALGRRRRRFS